MKLQTKSINRGFTLIEILVTLGLIALVVAIGSIANVNMYTRGLSSSEESLLVTTLQKVRSRAMNNIDASMHGLYIEEDPSGSGEYYLIVFSRDSSGSDEEEEPILLNKHKTIEVTGLDEVVFKQLSGEVENYIDEDHDTITISVDGSPVKVVEVKENGLIIW